VPPRVLSREGRVAGGDGGADEHRGPVLRVDDREQFLQRRQSGSVPVRASDRVYGADSIGGVYVGPSVVPVGVGGRVDAVTGPELWAGLPVSLRLLAGAGTVLAFRDVGGVLWTRVHHRVSRGDRGVAASQGVGVVFETVLHHLWDAWLVVCGLIVAAHWLSDAVED